MFLAISLGHIFKIADTRLEISHNNADLKLPLVIMDLCILLLYQLLMHCPWYWDYSIQKGIFQISNQNDSNWVILVQERIFGVVSFLKKGFSLIWVIWVMKKEVISCFIMTVAVAKWVYKVLKITCKYLFIQMATRNLVSTLTS